MFFFDFVKKVTNSDVRANAATLMFDVFPLQDPALHNEQADTALQRQFDLMHVGILVKSIEFKTISKVY